MENNRDKRPQGELLVYQGQGLNAPVQVRLEGENVWLSQKLIAELYGTTAANINQHISSIYADKELLPEATVKNFMFSPHHAANACLRTPHRQTAGAESANKPWCLGVYEECASSAKQAVLLHSRYNLREVDNG
jgi:hypothetical protein